MNDSESRDDHHPGQSDQYPWWREPYVWMVIAGPVSVVLACLVTAAYILQGPDAVVAESHYPEGLAMSYEVKTAPPPMQPAQQGETIVQREGKLRKNHDSHTPSRRAAQLPLVVWVGFLAACLLEGLVFSLVDPGEVHWPGRMPQPARQGIYTLAFFCFWIIGMASAWLALWLAAPQAKLNDTAGD